MNYWIVLSISACYLGILSLVAYYSDKRAKSGKTWLNNPYVYGLSLAVYCTAWTYYGSVGKAATDGLSFLTIYLGPVISMPLWWLLMRRIIRISNALRLTTLADFIATRFGKSVTLSVLVTLLSVLGVVPYISIQLKAINSSLSVIAHENSGYLMSNSAFLVTFLLAGFILIFTFRTVDSTQKHHGLVAAIALESLVKLVAFLLVGSFITFFLYDGFVDIFQRVKPEQLLKYESIQGSGWTVMLFLSMSAVLFLPRQFHVIVSENTNPNHLKTVMWLFPAYLLAINLFVIPVAIGGENLLSGMVDPDMYLLALPLHVGETTLALMTYLGGFSAATGMIIVSTIALSMMVSNNLVIPLIIKNYDSNKINQEKALIIRRVSVLVILMLSFLYFKFVSDRFSLVYIGLISFAAVAQFTPTVMAALFWKDVTKRGAIWSLLAGFTVWFYTLVIPSCIEVGLLPESWLTEGPLGMVWLKPEALLGMEVADPIVHGTFWALFFNMLFMVIGTLITNQTGKERNMADFYSGSYQYASDFDDQLVWRGHMIHQDLIRVLQNILGNKKTKYEVDSFSKKFGRPIEQEGEVSPQFVSHAERLLTGAIGASSARLLIASISKEEEIELSEVLAILKENQEITRLNHQLSAKSLELRKQTKALEQANARLMNLDEEKDEFISTVTHEMRTPLTSIRSISEILFDNPDLTMDEREHFLGTVVKETERMTRLINQVLDLEKLESGKTTLRIEEMSLSEVIETCSYNFKGLMSERQIRLKKVLLTKDLEIMADRDRLAQVMTNLFSNAVKYSPVGGELEVGVKSIADELVIWVKDYGKGIDQDSIQRIFDKFYQGRDQTRKKTKGTGLGLSITKRIIHMHGGEIWVDSKMGLSTTFYFSLPINSVHLVQVSKLDDI